MKRQLFFIVAASLVLAGCAGTPRSVDLKAREQWLEGSLKAAKTPVVIEIKNLVAGNAYNIAVFDRFNMSEKGGETGSTKTTVRRPDGSRGIGYEGTHDGVFYSDDPGGISIRAMDSGIRLSLETSKATGVGSFRIRIKGIDDAEFENTRLVRATVEGVPSIVKGLPASGAQPVFRYGLFLHGSSIVPEARDLQAEYGRGGDNLFITAEEGRFVELPFARSTTSLTLDSPARAKSALAVSRAESAASFLFDGGDQSIYYSAWKDSGFAEAVNRSVVARKVPTGGNSAGLAILSPYVYAALHDHDLTSKEALADPYNPWMTVENGVFALPGLENTIVESHFSERGRAGRLMAFLARLLADGRAKLGELYGIGVDENTCLVMDETGKARVYGPGAAWIFVPQTMPETCASGMPLDWKGKAVKAIRLQGNPGGHTIQGGGYLDWSSLTKLPATMWLASENGTVTETR